MIYKKEIRELAQDFLKILDFDNLTEQDKQNIKIFLEDLREMKNLSR